MRPLAVCLLPAFIALVSSSVAGAYSATAGGYALADSEEPGGPIFAWDDISTTGSTVPFTLVDDDQVTLPLPFSFTHFGTPFSSLSICTNGFVQFGGSSTSALNTGIPFNGPPNSIVAAFWDDLILLSGMTVRYATLGSAPNRRYVVSWDGVSTLAGGASTSLTFQIALYETSNAIRIQYLTMTGPGSDGASATVGSENFAGNAGIEYLHDGAPAGNAVYGSLAILLTVSGGGGGGGTGTTTGDPNHTWNCSQGAMATDAGTVALALALLVAISVLRLAR